MPVTDEVLQQLLQPITIGGGYGYLDPIVRLIIADIQAELVRQQLGLQQQEGERGALFELSRLLGSPRDVGQTTALAALTGGSTPLTTAAVEGKRFTGPNFQAMIQGLQNVGAPSALGELSGLSPEQIERYHTMVGGGVTQQDALALARMTREQYEAFWRPILRQGGGGGGRGGEAASISAQGGASFTLGAPHKLVNAQTGQVTSTVEAGESIKIVPPKPPTHTSTAAPTGTPRLTWPLPRTGQPPTTMPTAPSAPVIPSAPVTQPPPTGMPGFTWPPPRTGQPPGTLPTTPTGPVISPTPVTQPPPTGQPVIGLPGITRPSAKPENPYLGAFQILGPEEFETTLADFLARLENEPPANRFVMALRLKSALPSTAFPEVSRRLREAGYGDLADVIEGSWAGPTHLFAGAYQPQDVSDVASMLGLGYVPAANRMRQGLFRDLPYEIREALLGGASGAGREPQGWLEDFLRFAPRAARVFGQIRFGRQAA